MGIYIWGTGCGTAELFAQGLDPNTITAFVETSPLTDSFLGKPLLKPQQLPADDVELLLIASRHTEEIQKPCIALGLKQETLFFLKNQYILQDRNISCMKAKELLPPWLLQKLSKPCRIVREPDGVSGTLSDQKLLDSDYVRIKTLELLVQSISGISGAIAELGVYRGDFACIMNGLMPERKLYLFDSFDGFHPEEAQKELMQNTCSSTFLDVHKNTSASQVLNRMPHPEQVTVCPGYFPASLNALEEVFVLVSLDADFEDTTYEGLTYFWPRLNSGGYLMLHDYNSASLAGVKKAVRRYEQEHNIHLPGVPLCDICGTLVLCKP